MADETTKEAEAGKTTEDTTAEGEGKTTEGEKTSEGEKTTEGEDAGDKSLIGGEEKKEAAASEPLTAESLSELLPEGAEIGEEESAALLEAVNSAESRPELIRSLLAMHSEQMQAAGEALAGQHNELMTTWVDEIKTSPEFGGEKLGPALASAKETAERFGGTGFVELLNTTGVGNSIHMLKFLTEVHKALPQEPSTPPQGGPKTRDQSTAEKLFGGN